MALFNKRRKRKIFRAGFASALSAAGASEAFAATKPKAPGETKIVAIMGGGYVFVRGDRDVWVLWSKDSANHVVSLPGTPRTTYRIGTDGKPISLVASSSVTVTIAPVFIDWN